MSPQPINRLPSPLSKEDSSNTQTPYVVVLGTAQDGGYPQAGCQDACCVRPRTDPSTRRHVACLAIVDPTSRQRWLIECTPDFREQLHQLDSIAPPKSDTGSNIIDGILLTHAHIGHYAGLLQLGNEAIGSDRIPLFAMPRMRQFLENNAPWSQLVTAENVTLHNLQDGKSQQLNERIKVTPFLVPHRDEYSETVGFRIEGPAGSALFIPDIDRWDRWEQAKETRIEDLLESVDVAYLDGTFYADGELPGRDMSRIPHPFIAESMVRFHSLSEAERNKVRFLHLNHTNPVLDPNSEAAKKVRAAGYHVAKENERFVL